MPQSTGGRGRDYRESDVRLLFERGPEWRSWSEPIEWLRTFGKRDDDLRSADVRALISRDFGQLDRDRVPFTHEPGAAFRLAREHRHGQGIEQARVDNKPGFR